MSAWISTFDDGIAWLTFDLPGKSVNTFSAAAMNDLEAALQSLPAGARALVIRSGKPEGFIVGADIGELARLAGPDDAAAKSAAGHAVFARIAALPMPTIALIHGVCLGGGLEMALACTYRIVTDHEKTSLGQPEVNLGIIPGWGGTLRLPRLLGLGAALGMILTGKAADARGAWKSGLADAIVAAPFAEAETRRFIERVSTPQGRRAVLRRRRRCRGRLSRLLEAAPPWRRLMLSLARRGVLKRTAGHYPAPLSALDVIRATYRKRHPDGGASIEQAAFGALATTPQSRHLVWLFQASQRAKKADGKAGGGPVRSAGVVGAGIMGAGIAWALSNADVRVRLRDVSWDALARGMAAAAGMYRALVKRRKMTEGRMNLAMHRISPTVDSTGFGGAEVVIEAVAEDAELKKRVLSEIEGLVPPSALLCTNTSSLSLKDLAGALSRPERFLGLHFFNPVNRMLLVEVVPWSGTSPEAVVAAAQLVRQMGKVPMVVGDCAGFLVNRILLPYLVESAWMFEEGIGAERIDGLLEKFGMPMGPLALADEVGLDVGYAVAKVLEAAYGPRMHVPEALGAVAASRRFLGRKTGAGFYRYRKGRRRPNRRVRHLARDARRMDGVSARDLTDEQIVDRAILIMVNEAARCLEEGVVADAETVDMALVLGTGFAPFRGGLLRYADERGVSRIKERLDELAAAFGDRFKSAPLIERIANNGGRFYKEDAA